MRIKKTPSPLRKIDMPSPEEPPRTRHGRIFSARDQENCLDTLQLHQLEQAFRAWVDASPRSDVRLSRRRILLIFLLIRYTGAKLNEVLGLDPVLDIDRAKHTVSFGRIKVGTVAGIRQVQLPEPLCEEIGAAMADPAFQNDMPNLFKIDPGFVRRKFYERAADCQLPKHLGAPEVLRKSRAVELIQNNMPLPAVQVMLGHSTPNLTSAYLSFSEEEIQLVARSYMDRETNRKTSARNSFYGKIQAIHPGDIQSQIDLLTLGGNRITAVITNDSAQRLGLKEGKWLTAEIKAPWVLLDRSEQAPATSAENQFDGIIAAIREGAINTEYTVRIADGTEVCAIVATSRSQGLGLQQGDRVWVLFTCFAVVLHAD